jgi:hypothetical protein
MDDKMGIIGVEPGEGREAIEQGEHCGFGERLEAGN